MTSSSKLVAGTTNQQGRPSLGLPWLTSGFPASRYFGSAARTALVAAVHGSRKPIESGEWVRSPHSASWAFDRTPLNVVVHGSPVVSRSPDGKSLPERPSCDPVKCHVFAPFLMISASSEGHPRSWKSPATAWKSHPRSRT